MRLILVALMALSAASCATITRGTREAFTVNTIPSGARVETSLGLTCAATPCTFPDVRRNSDFTVTIIKEGYETWTGTVTHQTAGGGAAGMAGNVVFGGLIGVAVDAGSGATQELVPNPLNVTLTPLPAPAPEPEPEPAAVDPATQPAPSEIS
ncbi:MAG: PEGA domain-containing protein [Hyphomonadaceae bacterium]|nr:PEGA domain-containing protein [Hyphomonadaceae bacterium]